MSRGPETVGEAPGPAEPRKLAGLGRELARTGHRECCPGGYGGLGSAVGGRRSGRGSPGGRVARQAEAGGSPGPFVGSLSGLRAHARED